MINSDGNINDRSICEWDVVTDSSKTLNLEIERDANIYENIVIEYESSTEGKVEINNKELHSCSDGTFSLEVTGVEHFKVRVKILNPSSNYNILLSQTGIDYSYPAVLTRNKAFVQLIALSLFVLFCVLVSTIIVFAF